ncbi:MAG: hypothetical protein LBD77_08270 [Bifidobacteriaceae bacterium]|jgi:hypothetical protein|nr:hypothetical protein [Bifidobacteriaceae bacterium]
MIEPVQWAAAAMAVGDVPSDVGDFVTWVGVVLMVLGPAYYGAVRKRYGLMDDDDVKDQAVGSSCLIRQAHERSGAHDADIARRHLAAGSPFHCDYIRPGAYTIYRIGQKPQAVPTDRRAVPVGVERSDR